MPKQIPNYLKLVGGAAAEPVSEAANDTSTWDAACEAFRAATGWRIELTPNREKSQNSFLKRSAPVDPGVGAALGHLRIVLDRGQTAPPRLNSDDARQLGASVADLWHELQSTRDALWRREAELATHVSVAATSDNGRILAERLEAVLHGGATAARCQGAALYLLDAGTTSLKLRASWGLPRRRLLEEPRPLRGSLADLEALLGHAVVLTDAQLFDYWKVPEPCAAAVCIPVSSPTMPLGTAWFFSSTPREFSDAETNILEVVAGRLASDLERQVLLDQCTAQRRAQHDTAASLQPPSIAPAVAGWDVAAQATASATANGVFYDWFAAGDALRVAAGCTQRGGVEGILAASALRACVRTCGAQLISDEQLLRAASRVLFSSSTAGEPAGLFHAVLDADGDAVRLSAAGPLAAFRVGSGGITTVVEPSAPLGEADEYSGAAAVDRPLAVSRGEVLVVCVGQGLARVASARDALRSLLGDVQKRYASQSAADLAAGAVERLADSPQLADAAVLLIKRRGR